MTTIPDHPYTSSDRIRKGVSELWGRKSLWSLLWPFATIQERVYAETVGTVRMHYYLDWQIIITVQFISARQSVSNVIVSSGRTWVDFSLVCHRFRSVTWRCWVSEGRALRQVVRLLKTRLTVTRQLSIANKLTDSLRQQVIRLFLHRDFTNLGWMDIFHVVRKYSLIVDIAK